MQKLTKRLDQFFAFMKKQESDMIKPFYDNIHKNQVAIYNLQKKMLTHFEGEPRQQVTPQQAPQQTQVKPPQQQPSQAPPQQSSNGVGRSGLIQSGIKKRR